MAAVSASLRPWSRRFAVGTAATLAVVGLGVLALAHGLGQYTAAGRAFDAAAERALTDPSWQVRVALLRLLGRVTVPSLATVLVALVAVAALRRRWSSAIAVCVLVGGATVSSRILKYGVLERPALTESDNSLPSGHSTIAGAVALAALLLVPARWRAPAAGVAAFLGAGGGLTTLWAGTHRPVDVIAAVGLCAVWSAVAVLLARRDDPRDAAAAPEPGERGPASGWAVLGAAVPVAVIVARLAVVRPGGAGPGGVMALVIGALVAATVTLTAHALAPVAVDGGASAAREPAGSPGRRAGPREGGLGRNPD